MDVDGIREGRALTAVLPLLRDTLVSIADEAMLMMIVTDAEGHILWCAGQRDGLRRAEDGIVTDAVGINAMGTTVAADRAVEIHSDVRPGRTRHSWTCAACAIRDPDTGAVVGAVDVTGPARTIHPTTVALVLAVARLAESHLAAQLAVRDERLLSRNLANATGLRDGPAPSHVVLPAAGDRGALGDAGEGVLEPLAEGRLLRLQVRER
jgi:transcriptional regulator of acetoin/glycerol metabolism